MAVTAALGLRVAILVTMVECASAENPRPPYSSGMIMPKNLSSFRYCQAAGCRSLSICTMSQSSIILQNVSV